MSAAATSDGTSMWSRRICAVLDRARAGQSAARRTDRLRHRPPGHDARYAIDAAKLETELGWRAEETFETGIEKTVRWYLDNEWWWQPLRERYAGRAPWAARRREELGRHAHPGYRPRRAGRSSLWSSAAPAVVSRSSRSGAPELDLAEQPARLRRDRGGPARHHRHRPRPTRRSTRRRASPSWPLRSTREGARCGCARPRGAGRAADPLVHRLCLRRHQDRRPMSKSDPTGPAECLWRVQAAGEQAVARRAGNCACDLRTAWVYSPFGKNFVKTMLRLAGDRDEVGVVADQHGNPTCALDIADAIIARAAAAC